MAGVGFFSLLQSIRSALIVISCLCFFPVLSLHFYQQYYRCLFLWCVNIFQYQIVSFSLVKWLLWVSSLRFLALAALHTFLHSMSSVNVFSLFISIYTHTQKKQTLHALMTIYFIFIREIGKKNLWNFTTLIHKNVRYYRMALLSCAIFVSCVIFRRTISFSAQHVDFCTPHMPNWPFFIYIFFFVG